MLSKDNLVQTMTNFEKNLLRWLENKLLHFTPSISPKFNFGEILLINKIVWCTQNHIIFRTQTQCHLGQPWCETDLIRDDWGRFDMLVKYISYYC